MKKIVTCFMVVIALCVCAQTLFAEEKIVPQVMGYHSIIYDEGGNLIADGDIGVWFRILDPAGAVLYEERQTVTALNGQVSALIGNGLTAQGAPTGGVSLDALNPDGEKYLEVEVEGMTKLSPMEFASVPYATYAQEALSAAEGAIDGKAIAEGSLLFKNFAQDAIDGLTNAITGGKGLGQIVMRDELATLFRSPSAAANIGVQRGLTYSGANDLQGVLRDLDLALASRDEKIMGVQNNKVSKSGDTMNGTLNMSGNAITNLPAPINASDAARKADVDAVASAVGSEAAARSSADAAINGRIDGLDVRLDIVEDPQKISFAHSSWGKIKYIGNNPEFWQFTSGQNASLKDGGTMSSFTIVLDNTFLNDNYAVIVTPINPPSGYPEMKVTKSFNGGNNKNEIKIELNPTRSTPEVDFIVMGP